MNPGALTKFLLLSCFLWFFPTPAISQAGSSPEIRSMLRTASSLLVDIDRNQQPSVASNIATQQVRIGDISGALASLQRISDQRERAWATGNIASALAWQGNVLFAERLVRDSAGNDDQIRAQGYASMANQLAAKKEFEQSFALLHSIKDVPGFVGKTGLLVNTLMYIQSEQWNAGNQEGAENTLHDALSTIEQEKSNPFTTNFADIVPAQLYGGVVGTLAREGNRPAALAVLERIYDLASDAAPDRKPDFLFTLAVAQSDVGDVQAALHSMAEITDSAKRDTAAVVITMERNRRGEALEGLGLALGISGEFNRNTALRGIADSLAASGNYVQALETVDSIREPGERAYGLAELALEQAEKKDAGAAMIVGRAWQAAVNPRNETKSYVFAQIAAARGILGDFPGALEIIDTLAEEEKAWPLQNLAELLVHAGKATEAIALAEAQQSSYPKACVYLGIANQLIDEERERERRAQENSSSALAKAN